MDNPIKALRQSVGISQGDLIRYSGLNRMVVIRTEQGLYNSPSRQITDPLLSLLQNSNAPDSSSPQFPEISHEDIVGLYKTWQEYTQECQSYWVENLDYYFLKYTADVHPIVYFRKVYGPPVAKSRLGFCKAFCVHPHSQRLFEVGSQLSVPSSLAVALKRAGMPPVAVDMLQDSTLEWARRNA